jgi:hypothetical protein
MNKIYSGSCLNLGIIILELLGSVILLELIVGCWPALIGLTINFELNN